MSGAWGVADEHAATTVAEQVLSVFSPPESVPTEAALVVLVVLACAEGEWHTFPPRLAAELSRSPDLRILPLGGSISADHLRRSLRAARPAVLALSVTLTANLVGAARSIRAAVEEGVPVVVGGAAWGGSQERARTLGASAYLGDPTSLGDVIAGLEGPPPVSSLPRIPDEALLLDSPPQELMRLAYDHQLAHSPWMRSMTPYQVEETMRDFAWMARHAANAVLLDDPTIVGDLLRWLLDLLEPRGVPGGVVLDSALYLANAVNPVAPRAATVLRGEAQRVRRTTLAEVEHG
jgi:hypothetical protein